MKKMVVFKKRLMGDSLAMLAGLTFLVGLFINANLILSKVSMGKVKILLSPYHLTPLLMFISIPLFGFWIWMLVDCLKRTFKDAGTKIVWMLILFFSFQPGTVIYYLALKRKEITASSK